MNENPHAPGSQRAAHRLAEHRPPVDHERCFADQGIGRRERRGGCRGFFQPAGDNLHDHAFGFELTRMSSQIPTLDCPGIDHRFDQVGHQTHIAWPQLAVGDALVEDDFEFFQVRPFALKQLSQKFALQNVGFLVNKQQGVGPLIHEVEFPPDHTAQLFNGILNVLDTAVEDLHGRAGQKIVDQEKNILFAAHVVVNVAIT